MQIEALLSQRAFHLLKKTQEAKSETRKRDTQHRLKWQSLSQKLNRMDYWTIELVTKKRVIVLQDWIAPSWSLRLLRRTRTVHGVNQNGGWFSIRGNFLFASRVTHAYFPGPCFTIIWTSLSHRALHRTYTTRVFPSSKHLFCGLPSLPPP